MNRILCKYPTIQPRSSINTIRKFEELSDDELENIYLNAISDVYDKVGSPVSVVISQCLAVPMEAALQLEGLTEEMLADRELQVELHSTIGHYLGDYLTGPFNFVLRMVAIVQRMQRAQAAKKRGAATQGETEVRQSNAGKRQETEEARQHAVFVDVAHHHENPAPSAQTNPDAELQNGVSFEPVATEDGE